MFIWGVEKCLETNIAYLSNPNWQLVLKKMDRVWA
jgi:hypothetical protein